MLCEKYVARINIPVPPHHKEPMNCKNDYFSYMTLFLDTHGGLIFVVVMIVFFVILMVCEYVVRINIPVPLHHEEPMNCKNDYFSYMTFFLDDSR